MMKRTNILLALLIAAVLPSCKDAPQQTAQRPPVVADTMYAFGPDRKIDYNQDLSKLSLQALRLLRSELYAKQGYCFMEADLRAYFSAYMRGYDSIMEARYFAEEENHAAPITFTDEEKAFIKKIEALEAERKKNNFSQKQNLSLANVSNIVNLFQFKDLSPALLDRLDKDNVAIAEGNDQQLFHVYEANDYRQVPNFVTTDMYLQLYHMYFTYLLRSLETKKFIPIITELSDGMHAEAMKTAATAKDEQVRQAAEFTEAFYAIPYYLLTGKKKEVPADYRRRVDYEIAAINAGQDAPSLLLETKAHFGYSLFKPRGHYTRTDELRKYFKAMMWLQTASFCRETPAQLGRTVFMAQLLGNGKSPQGHALMGLYNAVYEPIVFLIGEPDNLSVNDIVAYNKQNNISDAGAAMQPAAQQRLDAHMVTLAKSRNRIKPKVEITCPDKINFMPQRYLFDNEILQELVDVHENAARAYPRGLDIFAALGNKHAENILLNEYKDGEGWGEYKTELDKLKEKFTGYKEWDKTVYNKWVSTLDVMQHADERYPAFMNTDVWHRKDLNTSLASWTDLKHDAILYGEQPAGAECGGGGPPDPNTVGYVEPNINFWKSMQELLSLTNEMLKRNDLLTEDINAKTKSLTEMTQFLLTASEKELKHEKLSEQEYKTIETIGASTEYLTLSIVEPDKSLDKWEDVQGPDKSVAVVADVYTRNITGCQKNGILHEGVGNVNSIFVVVEIEGYLYLTRGAVFSYYEFVQPPGVRLTDEEWQKMLEDRKAPALPQWMKDVILPAKNAPKADEKVSYSSGC